MERLYGLNETSRLLALHPRTIQKMDKAGKIRATRIQGGRRRIPESEIKRLKGQREGEGEEEKRFIIGYARVSPLNPERRPPKTKATPPPPPYQPRKRGEKLL